MPRHSKRYSRESLPIEVTRSAEHPFLKAAFFPSKKPLIGDNATKALVAAVPGWNFTAPELDCFLKICPSLLSTMKASQYQESFDSICWAYRLLNLPRANARTGSETPGSLEGASPVSASSNNSSAGSLENSRASSPFSVQSSCTSATSASTHGSGSPLEGLPEKFQDVQMLLGGVSTTSCLFDTTEEEIQEEVEPSIFELLSLVMPDEAKENELFHMAFSIDEAAELSGIGPIEAADHMGRVLEMYVRNYWAMLQTDTNPFNENTVAYIVNTRHTINDVGIRWRHFYERLQVFIDLAGANLVAKSKVLAEQDTKECAKAQVDKAIARKTSPRGHARTESKPLIFRPDLEFKPTQAYPSLAEAGTVYPGVPDYLVPLIFRIGFLARFEACMTRPRWDRLLKYASEDHELVLDQYMVDSMRQVALASCVYFSRQMDHSEFEKDA